VDVFEGQLVAGRGGAGVNEFARGGVYFLFERPARWF
jgi:hypothetical protein